MNRASSLRLRETPTPSSFCSRSNTVSAMAWLLFRGSRGGLRREFRRCRAHRFDDVLVAGAAAQIARHPIANFLIRRVRVFLQQPIGPGNHARRAKSALQGMIQMKRFLQRVQLAARGKTLDREQLRALTLDR